jgi:hypothetical protein
MLKSFRPLFVTDAAFDVTYCHHEQREGDFLIVNFVIFVAAFVVAALARSWWSNRGSLLTLQFFRSDKPMTQGIFRNCPRLDKLKQIIGTAGF